MQFYCKYGSGDYASAMDRIDRKLLNLLQRDASRTNVDMADEVGLSPSSCLRRTQRLRKSGVIDRIVAILNPAKAGRMIKALVTVELKLHGEQHMRRLHPQKPLAQKARHHCTMNRCRPSASAAAAAPHAKSA